MSGDCEISRPETSISANTENIEQERLPTDPADRVASTDALRGLVILAMIFVNAAAGVKAAPTRLKHVSARADAMTLPDVVLPAFLLTMAMSTPLARGRVGRSAR